MTWSKPLGYYDDMYYSHIKFVLVKETPKAIRIKIISTDSSDGLCIWMPKKLTKNYNDYNPNIKTAWFWNKLFRANISKALSKKMIGKEELDPSAWKQVLTGKEIRNDR